MFGRLLSRYEYNHVCSKMLPYITIPTTITGGVLANGGFNDTNPRFTHTLLRTSLGVVVGSFLGGVLTTLHPLVVPVVAIAVPVHLYKKFQT